MTVRSINGPAACAATVAKTGKDTLLLNLPRSIDEIDQATTDNSLRARLSRWFA